MRQHKAQFFISFIIGVSLFLAVCFSVALFASNKYPEIIKGISSEKNSFVFLSFVSKVMGNISQGEYIINESITSLSECTLLNMNDASSLSNYSYFQKKFGVENYSYMIDITELPIAVTTEQDGNNYTGTFNIDGKKIDTEVSSTNRFYDTVTITYGLNSDTLSEGEYTSLFNEFILYVEKIDEKGQFVIFKKQLISCGNYYNIMSKYSLLEKKYLLSEDNNIIYILLAIW